MAELFDIDAIPLNGQQWRYGEKFIVEQDLVRESYIVDGNDGNKFDLVLFSHVWLSLINFKEGFTYTFILNRDEHAMSIPAVYLFFTSEFPLKWQGLTEENVTIETNAMIKIYKSRGVIYARLIKDFVADAGSDS